MAGRQYIFFVVWIGQYFFFLAKLNTGYMAGRQYYIDIVFGKTTSQRLFWLVVWEGSQPEPLLLFLPRLSLNDELSKSRIAAPAATVCAALFIFIL